MSFKSVKAPIMQINVPCTHFISLKGQSELYTSAFYTRERKSDKLKNPQAEAVLDIYLQIPFHNGKKKNNVSIYFEIQRAYTRDPRDSKRSDIASLCARYRFCTRYRLYVSRIANFIGVPTCIKRVP